VWKRVNPGHGITVQHDAIAAECEKARRRAAEAERLPPLHAQPVGERRVRVDASRLVGRVPRPVDDAAAAGALDSPAGWIWRRRTIHRHSCSPSRAARRSGSVDRGSRDKRVRGGGQAVDLAQLPDHDCPVLLDPARHDASSTRRTIECRMLSGRLGSCSAPRTATSSTTTRIFYDITINRSPSSEHCRSRRTDSSSSASLGEGRGDRIRSSVRD
jgi:hypothetical protein